MRRITRRGIIYLVLAQDFLKKLTFFAPLVRTSKCAYQRERNNNLLQIFANVLILAILILSNRTVSWQYFRQDIRFFSLQDIGFSLGRSYFLSGHTFSRTHFQQELLPFELPKSKILLWFKLYLKRDSGTSVFVWILQNFWEHLFYRTRLGECFYIMQNWCK